MEDYKVTIYIEQYDNGISLKWLNQDTDSENLVAYNEDIVESIGRMVWDDIRHLMDNRICNEVKMDITYHTST